MEVKGLIKMSEIPEETESESKPDAIQNIDQKKMFQMAVKRVMSITRVTSSLMGSIKLNIDERSRSERKKDPEREKLLASIAWLSYHIPECVVMDLNKDIESILSQKIDTDDLSGDELEVDDKYDISTANDSRAELHSIEEIDNRKDIDSSPASISHLQYQDLSLTASSSQTSQVSLPSDEINSSNPPSRQLSSRSRQPKISIVEEETLNLEELSRPSLSTIKTSRLNSKFSSLFLKEESNSRSGEKDESDSIECVQIFSNEATKSFRKVIQDRNRSRTELAQSILNDEYEIMEKSDSFSIHSFDEDIGNIDIPSGRKKKKRRWLRKRFTDNTSSKRGKSFRWFSKSYQGSHDSSKSSRRLQLISARRFFSRKKKITHIPKRNSTGIFSFPFSRRSLIKEPKNAIDDENDLESILIDENKPMTPTMNESEQDSLMTKPNPGTENSFSSTINFSPAHVIKDDHRKRFTSQGKTPSIKRRETAIGLPYIYSRESALLFVDISGFTKLSTLVQVETLSSSINSYFEIITNEINLHGGDVLKFAGDAVFAEWKSSSEKNITIATCVTLAANCGSKIVSTCADFPIYVSDSDRIKSKAVSTLNVHCGIGVGEIKGVHVGNNISHREFIILGEPIDQVAEAEELASLGELVASQDIIDILSKTHDFSEEIRSSDARMPKVIATPTQKYFKIRDEQNIPSHMKNLKVSDSTKRLKLLCSKLDGDALKELRKLFTFYVHPVVVADDEVELSNPTKRSASERIQEEAELRPVYVMFITPLIDLKLTGNYAEDKENIDLLNDIFLVTLRELDRFKGHLRQFIVDDKGVVLIATFGLRGSTSQDMIANRALPATKVIHKALLNELNVENRIGATLGQVYCGVIGGIQRHEYAVLGPSVNLAARLMASTQNPGILVDNEVRRVAGKSFVFNALQPVKAKGYTEKVRIFEPVGLSERQWKKADPHFVGRTKELKKILYAGKSILTYEDTPKFFLISGDPLTGKSSLLVQCLENIATISSISKRPSIRLRHVNNEEKSHVELYAFKSIFCDLLDELHRNDYDQTFFTSDNTKFNDSHEFFSLLCEKSDAPSEFISYMKNNFLKSQNEHVEENIPPPNWDLIIEYLARIIIFCANRVNMIVIALDDVHHMDEQSWNLLEKFFEKGSNLLIICSRTTLATSKLRIKDSFWNRLHRTHSFLSHFEPITLSPLDETQIKKLCSNHLKDFEVDEDWIGNISKISNGVPGVAMRLIETIKKIDLDKTSERQTVIEELFKHSSVSDIFNHQMDCLDFYVRSILQFCAVIGVEFTLYQIVAITEQWRISLEGVVPSRIEHAKDIHGKLDVAVNELILDEVYQGEGNEKDFATDDENDHLQQVYPNINRVYRFRHETWRESILKLMLESQKQEIQSKIERAMEEIKRKTNNS